MSDLYFMAFEKYGPALSALWPSQHQVLQKALDTYAKSRKITKIDDMFTRLAFMMIVCDIRYTAQRNNTDEEE